MIKPKYLNGVGAVALPQRNGVFAIKNPRKVGSWYYVSTYNYFNNYKRDFFHFISTQGQKEDLSMWELHHVVERQHLAGFHTKSEVDMLYKNVWPCIFIPRNLHLSYSSVLHSKGSQLIFQSKGETSLTPKGLASLYRTVYEGNSVLQTIANNVIADIAGAGR